MAASWRIAKSLDKLRKQINTLYPDRSKVSDGAIGDTAHSARTSDHNPDSDGVVCAIDITHDPRHGVDGQELADQLITDARTKYVIFNSRIWKARTGKWEAYRGANPHKHHVHISVQQETKDKVSDWPVRALDDAVSEPKPEKVEVPVSDVPKPAEPSVSTVPSKPPVVEVKPQGVSTLTKIGAAAGPVGTAITALGIKIGGIQITQGTIYAFCAVAVIALVCSTIIYITGKQREMEKLRISMNNMADPDRANVVAGK